MKKPVSYCAINGTIFTLTPLEVLFGIDSLPEQNRIIMASHIVKTHDNPVGFLGRRDDTGEWYGYTFASRDYFVDQSHLLLAFAQMAEIISADRYLGESNSGIVGTVIESTHVTETCAACGATVYRDVRGTLIDETGGDVCTERGDDTPHVTKEA